MNLLTKIKKYLITKKLVKQSKRDLDQAYIQQEVKIKTLTEGLKKYDK